MTDDRAYTLEEAAKLLGSSRADLQRMVKSGTLRAFRVDGGWRFRRRDIRGLKRIQALLADNKALPSARPMPTEPSPDVWKTFQKGGVVDFEAMTGLESSVVDDLEEPEGSGELQPLGDSVFTDALFGRSMTLDALVDALEEDPRSVSESLEPEAVAEIKQIAQEISGANPKLKPEKKQPRKKPTVAAEPPPPGLEKKPPAAVFDDDDDDEDEEGSPVVKAIFALILIAGFAAVLYIQATEEGAAVELPEVLVAPLRKGDIEQVVSARGAVEAVRQLNATCDIRGEVQALYVKVGQRVKKGETVARLEAVHLDEEIDTAQRQLEAKQLALREANVTLQNARSMIKKERSQIDAEVKRQIRGAEDALDRAQTRKSTASKNVETLEDELRRVRALRHGSEPDVRIKKLETNLKYARLEENRALAEVEDANKELARVRALRDPNHPAHKTRLAPAEGNIRKAELSIARIDKEIQNARERLEKANARLSERDVKSPLEGIVEKVEVDVGDFVAANSVLVRISDRSKLRVVAQVDETDVTRIAPGRPAKIQLEAMRDRELKGEVVRIATQGKKKAGSGISFFPTDILLLDEGGEPLAGLRPGLTAFVEIAVESARKVLVVPIEAVQKRRGKEHLLIVEDGPEGGQVIAEVEVMTGMSDARQIELTFFGKLKPGALIVVGPYRQLERLRAGDQVKVVATEDDKAKQ